MIIIKVIGIGLGAIVLLSACIALFTGSWPVMLLLTPIGVLLLFITIKLTHRRQAE